jgi:hypothetical protein
MSFFQFCDVAQVVIINPSILPNLNKYNQNMNIKKILSTKKNHVVGSCEGGFLANF